MNANDIFKSTSIYPAAFRHNGVNDYGLNEQDAPMLWRIRNAKPASTGLSDDTGKLYRLTNSGWVEFGTGTAVPYPPAILECFPKSVVKNNGVITVATQIIIDDVPFDAQKVTKVCVEVWKLPEVTIPYFTKPIAGGNSALTYTNEPGTEYHKTYSVPLWDTSLIGFAGLTRDIECDGNAYNVTSTQGDVSDSTLLLSPTSIGCSIEHHYTLTPIPQDLAALCVNVGCVYGEEQISAYYFVEV